MMNTIEQLTGFTLIKNQECVALQSIPLLSYEHFFQSLSKLLSEKENHCVNYYAYPFGTKLRFIACIANDKEASIAITSHEMSLDSKKELPSLSKIFFPLHIFEREIHENFNVTFTDHPWLKPVRYAFNQADKSKVIPNYPFYKIESQELHQVGVGPIHAGVIEPGHFRFTCNGENVLHLEIQLGWQHRGIEELMLKKKSLLQRLVLTESIASDTAIGHCLAFASMIESLSGARPNKRLDIERTISLELERIAMHVGDLGNLNIGTAYQLAASVFGTLRTPAINYTQTWCGNRFGKGLIRIGGSHYPLTEELRDKLHKFLDKFEQSFQPMSARLFSLPSALSRFENIGKVSKKQMELIGAVGMTARMAGVERDVRLSHPFAGYKHYNINSETLENGDVWARAYLRKLEIENSIEYIRDLLDRLKDIKEEIAKPKLENELSLAPDSLCVSLTEGWRGEICHCSITDSSGKIIHYKIKDPSVHNWFALALSLRDLEISDFPINNKSYNLSYCGHDL